MGEPRPCPECGTPTLPETKFCGQCGRDLSAPSRPAVKRTLLGGAFQPAGARPAGTADSAGGAGSSIAAKPARRDFAQTLFDPSVPTGAPASAEPAPVSSGPAPSATDGGKGAKRTMMGMPVAAPGPLPVGTATPLAAPTSADAAAPPMAKRTMLGMQAPIPAGPTPSEPASPVREPPSPHRVKPAVSNRTMLGAAPPAELVAAAVKAAPGPGPRAPSPQSNRTMLGVGLDGAPAVDEPPASTGVAPEPSADAALGDPSLADVPGLSSRRRGRGPRVLAVLLALAALGLLGGGAYFFFGQSSELRVSVGQSDEGEVLFVDVPGAPEGTRVRFSGREQPLVAGRAAFPLAANDLQLGDNEVSVDVVAPDGSTRQASVVLSLAYRVRADLSALEEDPPSLRVVVDAPPSATVTLDERPVPLDATGHGHLEFSIEGGDEGPTYDRTVHYRVVLDGEPSSGEVHVRIPFATLQIDRPGAHTVTDKGAVELAGAAHPEAQVTLDGRPLELTEGRFVASIPVPELGETRHTVVAREPGRAPRVKELTIRRVADLAAEATAYPVDPSLTYARIAQNPESYRGQHVAFEGRVYNVDVHDGRSVLQILARECPRGQRCALWVAFDGATDAELNDWVRVVGEIAGEQQFRTPSGDVRAVPRVDAAFVLEREAPATTSRRGGR